MGVPRSQPRGFQFSPDSGELALERMCWEILTLVTRGLVLGNARWPVEGRQALAVRAGQMGVKRDSATHRWLWGRGRGERAWLPEHPG